MVETKDNQAEATPLATGDIVFIKHKYQPQNDTLAIIGNFSSFGTPGGITTVSLHHAVGPNGSHISTEIGEAQLHLRVIRWDEAERPIVTIKSVKLEEIPPDIKFSHGGNYHLPQNHIPAPPTC